MGQPSRELERQGPGSKELAPVDCGLGPSGRARRRIRESASGAGKATRTYWLWTASRRPPTSGLPGGPPASRLVPPRGAVAAGTASEHQVPLRPRAPPLGGNGQRACARTRLRFLPRGGACVGSRPAAPHLGIAEINLATTPPPSLSDFQTSPYWKERKVLF